MAEIVKNRTIRPSTRLETSNRYKIDTKNVSKDDILIVNIDHETEQFNRTYRFNGTDVADRNSIHFEVSFIGSDIHIRWSGAIPI